MTKKITVACMVGKRRQREQKNQPALICLGWIVALLSLAINVGMLHKFRSLHGTGEPSNDAAPATAGSSAVGEMARRPPASSGSDEGVSVDDGGCSQKSRGACSGKIGSTTAHDHSVVINVDHGDPKMYEPFWKVMEEKASVVFTGWQTMSYFSRPGSLCWFLEPRLADEIVRLHRLVGNARTDGWHILVGTGSTQLFQAALYALSPPDAAEPVSVVSAAPYYSSFASITEFLQSKLYRWAGDANAFQEEDAPFIEIVCCPSNPDGFMNKAVLDGEKGKLIHDLAYYWPQYAPITAAAAHDVMLFTFSKITGHAGTRIGWALVKDRKIAERMVKFIELNTIGVSKDSQLRAAKILAALSDGYEFPVGDGEVKFFDFGRRLMANRWQRLRAAVEAGGTFSLPDFPSANCSFNGDETPLLPAFAWVKCKTEEGVEGCAELLRRHNILPRGGKHFGVGPEYARVSMLDKAEDFDLLIERLSSMR